MNWWGDYMKSHLKKAAIDNTQQGLQGLTPNKEHLIPCLELMPKGKSMGSKQKKENQFDLYAANAWVRELELPSGLKAILYSLVTRMDHNGTCYPGLSRLAKDAGYKHEKSVSRNIAILKYMGLVKVQARNKGFGKKMTNLYSIPALNTKFKNFITEETLEGSSIKIWLEEVIGAFNHKEIAYPILAKFWYSLRDQFYPSLPKHPLSKYDAGAIKEILRWCVLREEDDETDPQQKSFRVLAILGIAVAYWEDLRPFVDAISGQSKLPKYPTPVACRDKFDFIDYWLKTEFSETCFKD